jgi:hypothetical protein
LFFNGAPLAADGSGPVRADVVLDAADPRTSAS